MINRARFDPAQRPERQPNDSIEIDRAASDPTIWSSCWAAPRMARRARLTKVRMGRSTSAASAKRAFEWKGGTRLRDVIQFSVCALTP